MAQIEAQIEVSCGSFATGPIRQQPKPCAGCPKAEVSKTSGLLEVPDVQENRTFQVSRTASLNPHGGEARVRAIPTQYCGSAPSPGRWFASLGEP